MARERGTRNTEQLCRAPLIMVRVFVNKSHVLFQRSCQGEIVDYGVSLAFRADAKRICRFRMALHPALANPEGKRRARVK